MCKSPIANRQIPIANYLLSIICCLSFSGCAYLPEIIIVNDPLSAREHADLAAIYEEKGEYDLAIREGEESLKSDPHNLKVLIALGNSHFQKGEHDKASKYYKKALKNDPKNGDLMNNMAMLYMAMGKLDDAEGLAKEAIATGSPHLSHYYDTLGRIYEKKGDEDKAQKAFNKARETPK